MKTHSRPFHDEQDLRKMREMLIDARRVAGHYTGYWHVGDLAWRYFLMSFRVDPRHNIRLWEEDDALVGYALFGDDFSVDWQVRPADCWQGIEEEMLAWAETRWGEAMNDLTIPHERKRDLWTGALQSDKGRIAFLERHGFAPGIGAFIHFLRSLDEPIPSSAPPDGFTVRAVAGEHEAANRASAHREAFHPSRVTDEGYLRLMQMPEYERHLDVVAVAPDGTLAAFAMGWLDPANKIGEFEPVGARAAFRGQGLTRAVLLEGLHRMKARGADTAMVCAGESNDVAVRLYESVGFRRVNRDVDYIKHGAKPK